MQTRQIAASILSVYDPSIGDRPTNRELAMAMRLTYGRINRSTAALLPVASMTTSSSRLSVLAKSPADHKPGRNEIFG